MEAYEFDGERYQKASRHQKRKRRRQSDFRRAVIDSMLQRAMQPDGTCFETFRRIRVYAVK